jgi:hypothetical protein
VPALAAASTCVAVLSHEATVLTARAIAEVPGDPQIAYGTGLIAAIVFGGWATLDMYTSFETSTQEIWGRGVAEPEPPRLRALGAVLFVLATAANAVVVAYFVELVWYPLAGTRLLPWLYPTTLLQRIPDAVAPPVSTVPFVDTGIAVLPLHIFSFAPIVTTWLLGVGYVGYRTIGRYRLLDRAESLEWSDPFKSSDSLDVLVTERDGVTVRPARTLRGVPVVVINAQLADHLDEEELTAVVAHEAKHLSDANPLGNVLAGLATLLPTVGPNSVRAFRDTVTAEQDADDAAVAAVGLETTMRALRKVDDFQRASPTERYRGLAGPELIGPSVERLRNAWDESFGRLGLKQLAHRVGLAYYFLFGRAVYDAAHAPLEVRLRQLQERHNGGDE